MKGPLAGVRVVELAGIGPGPFCGMLLADLGADVICVERDLRPKDIADTGILRRGKRSLVLDLKHPLAPGVVLGLARRSDILLEGFRPGVAERLGVGPEPCRRVNPRLVYGRITGWGQDGPLAHTAGHDIDYIALTGALHAIGTDKPTPPLNLLADFGGGGMLMAVGVLAAYVRAAATGEGDVVDAAMYDGVNLLMTMFWEMFGAGGWTDRRRDNVLDGGAPFCDTYRCLDGRWIAVGAIEPKFRRALFDTLELSYSDADLGMDRGAWPAMRDRLELAFARRPRDEWCERFASVEACVAPVLTMREAPDHPHARARQAFLPAGAGVQPAPAPRFGTSRPVPAAPPGRGGQTEEILVELGLGLDERHDLLRSGAVAGGDAVPQQQ